MSLLLGEQEGQDVSKGRMFVGADVIATNQSWMLSAGGSGSSAWEEASVSQPRGWPEEHAALMSSLITQQVASAPSCRVCVGSWRPWPPPWCAWPGLSLSPADGPRHGDALPHLSTGCSHVESQPSIWAGSIGAGPVISEVIS